MCDPESGTEALGDNSCGRGLTLECDESTIRGLVTCADTFLRREMSFLGVESEEKKSLRCGVVEGSYDRPLNRTDQRNA